MNPQYITQQLQQKQIITPEQANLIIQEEAARPLSLHWELNTLLFIGVSMVSAGLGVLVYKNIDTIGHQAIIAFIALVTVACLWYALRHRKPYTNSFVPSANIIPDYALLLGCMTFLTLEGYLQYQYTIFGDHYGLATLIPALIFFPLAYLFDHRGVLTMAITAFATWAGVTITPLNLLKENTFSNHQIIITGLAVGLILIAAGIYSERTNTKKHFSFTYLSLGANLAFIAALSGEFNYNKWIFCIIAIALTAAAIQYARQTKSYLFLLMGVIYGYIAITYWLFTITEFGESMIYAFYLTLSCIGLISFLSNFKKILNNEEHKT